MCLAALNHREVILAYAHDHADVLVAAAGALDTVTGVEVKRQERRRALSNGHA